MPSLTLAQANKIVEAALAKAREMKIKPLAVAVLDSSGHPKSLQREDEASMFRVDVAMGKAWASVGMGASSRTLLGRAEGEPAVLRRAGSHGAGQVPAADRRGSDQGRSRQHSGCRGCQWRHGRRRRGGLHCRRSGCRIGRRLKVSPRHRQRR